MAGVYTGLGIFNYLLFILLFAIICEKTLVYVFPSCNIPSLASIPPFCSTDNGYWTKHQTDSFDQFWGASLVAFILGAFQIGSGILIFNSIPIIEPPPSAAYQSAPQYTNTTYVGANPGGQPGMPLSNAENPNQIPPTYQNQVLFILLDEVWFSSF